MPAQNILIDVFVLLAALVVILGAAELFTNGIEWLGKRLQLSEGIVGSVFAAIGTAMPETLIPIVAISLHNHQYHEIGVGAIVGAPFMLTTLTMSVCGISIWLFSLQGIRSKELSINKIVLSRDLCFFIFAYSLALLTVSFHKIVLARQSIAILLLFTYFIYLKKSFAHEGEIGEPPEHLHFERLFKLEKNLAVIVIQVLFGLAGILFGAYLFVEHTKSLATAIAVPALILSMIIAPIATELPEKFNSVLWSRNKKDTLALGNITGSLVFQSCFPVAFGIAFTNWKLGLSTLTSGIIAISCALFYLILIRRNALRYYHLMLGGLVYLATVSWLIVVNL